MSAVIPPKAKPRQPIKLTIPSSPQPSLAPSSTSSSSSSIDAILTPAGPPVSTKPSLKIASVNAGLAGLSLAVPTKRNDDSDDEDGEGKRWGPDDKRRMTGELLDAIHGPPSTDDLLAVPGGHARPRSSSRVGVRTAIEVDPSAAIISAEEAVDDEETYPVNEESLRDLGRLGEGASGEVRKVLHVPTGTVMAKKTIDTSPNPKVHRQHLRELLFMRECKNPHIVRYFGGFLQDNNTQIGIVMEYCAAGSLDSLYKKHKRNGWRTGEKTLSKIAEGMLKGLGYLHSRKIIHRDIKPSNVLLTLSGQVKLCDFGVSGELVNSFAKTFLGTTFFLSPERMRSEGYTITSDVWSMALTILEVTTQRFPFPLPGEPPINGLLDLMSYWTSLKDPALVLESDEGLKYTGNFKAFVRACLERDPKRRPTPEMLLESAWIQKSINRPDQADLARWVGDVLDTDGTI